MTPIKPAAQRAKQIIRNEMIAARKAFRIRLARRRDSPIEVKDRKQEDNYSDKKRSGADLGMRF